MAAFELHVWGPAFSLPSIDPHCLAAIAYLSCVSHLATPDLQWTLVASNDASISPTSEPSYLRAPSRDIDLAEHVHQADGECLTEELPALRHNSTTIGGFQNISEYLRSQNSSWDLDDDFNCHADSSADLIAFTSHTFSHAPPLLSLSLFVSSENYTSTTRPTYSRLLPWPTQYIIPPRLRSRAKTLTAHLGLSSLDLDEEDDEQAEARRNNSLIPDSLRAAVGRQQTITSALRSQQTSTRFRLDALADAFCEPLVELLAGKKYLLSETHPSTLDCLAAAHLALMLQSDVPHSWLRDGITQRWKPLEKYTNTTSEALWSSSVHLPWQEFPPPHTIASTTALLANHTLSSLPCWTTTTTKTTPSAADPAPTTPKAPAASPPQPHTLPTVLLTATATATALAALASYLLLPSLSTAPTAAGNGDGDGAMKRNLSDMGEAGAMLEGGEAGWFAPVGAVE